MKKYLLPILSFAAAFAASAQDEVLKITLNDGTTTTIAVSEIKSLSFETAEQSEADLFAGEYTGTQSVIVGGMYTYDTTMTYTLIAESDGTLTVKIPQYSLSGTMMGDLTLGELTISGLEYDEEKGGFYRFYANDGLTQHFLAVNNGSTVFDKDYELGGESSILITRDGAAIAIENPFKLGAMPLSLTAKFEGSKQ